MCFGNGERWLSTNRTISYLNPTFASLAGVLICQCKENEMHGQYPSGQEKSERGSIFTGGSKLSARDMTQSSMFV
jgi:hypothetical protein